MIDCVAIPSWRESWSAAAAAFLSIYKIAVHLRAP
jgi:hypothetical protein